MFPETQENKMKPIMGLRVQAAAPGRNVGISPRPHGRLDIPRAWRSSQGKPDVPSSSVSSHKAAAVQNQ